MLIPPLIGGVKDPAATICAKVMVVFGSAREPRLSHDAAVAGGALNASTASTIKEQTKPVV